jgi:hypothetical protein
VESKVTIYRFMFVVQDSYLPVSNLSQCLEAMVGFWYLLFKLICVMVIILNYFSNLNQCCWCTGARCR